MLNRPLPLLLTTGSLLGLNFPLGKLAGAAGISPLVWSLLMSAGAGLVLALALWALRDRLPWDRRHLRYYLVTGAVSNALPNLLVFSAMPHLGAGFTSIFLAFSPILTLLLHSMLQRRRPGALGAAGIALGFVGALVIVLSKGGVDSPGGAPALWLALAFLIPLLLACGNVYRTLAWPAGTSGLALAAGTNLGAAAVLAVLSLLWTGSLPVATALAVPGLLLAQIAVTAAMFAVFFRLQRVGGPVYLSQIGYVAAAVGLGTGTFVLGEHYGVLTWLGAVVVAVGVLMTTREQQAAGK
ncbi:EamA-like transporter family protein [Rhodoferax sp. OV413]|uniref:DMT family transporter n=1 Tax=Rhodoferax sp. OV413 TaxID=1855285 RepID=UPI000881895E|nr:DMT family transporter [Rhodoferax sp. OV413]SDP13225.1 EamA-like transporter family protein [Rhodoferax sp. OV413]